MRKRRIIPVILLKEGQIIQSKKFSKHQFIGDPVNSVKRYSSWNADEIIYLNISGDWKYEQAHRKDIKTAQYGDFFELIKKVAAQNLCPITFGGGLHSFSDVQKCFENGADKVCFCSAYIDKEIELFDITRKTYGQQAMVIVFDTLKINNEWYIYDYRKNTVTNEKLEEGIRNAEHIGFGEILIQDVGRDGQKNGFDIELFSFATELSSIPILALGGAGDQEHFEELLEKTTVDAICGANYFQHFELSVIKLRSNLAEKRKDIRI
jgi:cyclase